MSAEFQCVVFLSHSSKDMAVVRPLAERLPTGRGTVHTGPTGQQGGQQSAPVGLVHKASLHAVEGISRVEEPLRPAGHGVVTFGHRDVLT